MENNKVKNEKDNRIILCNSNIINNDNEAKSKDKDNKKNINLQNIIYNELNTSIEILGDDIQKTDLNFKIIVIGNSGVGKSCLSLRASKNIFKEDFISTIGFEFFNFNVKINNKIIKLQIWDTCGQEIYRSLISGFYRSTELAIVVYSVVDKKSFYDIEIWLKQLKTHGSPDCKVFLIGNKIDLPNRVVSSEEGINCKTEHDFECYMETSAKNNININELFVNCAMSLYKKYIDEGKENELNGDINGNNFNLDNGIKEEENDCQC